MRDAVDAVLDGLDGGTVRVAEKKDGAWTVNQWLKKAVLLSFRLNDNDMISGGPGGAAWWDKVPSKFMGWDDSHFTQAGFRAVPGSGGAPLRLHRAGRGADAVLRQCRRLCRRGHHGRHLGDGGFLRPDRQESCISPAAPASAACWSRCRPGR